MALEPPDDLIELPSEVYERPPALPVPPNDLVDAEFPTVPYGMQPDLPPQAITLNDQQKNFLNTTAVGRVMNAFGQGIGGMWQSEIGFPKEMQQLRESGAFFRPEQEMTDPLGITFQLFAESLIAPAAKGLDVALRLGLSPLVGAARGLGQASVETGLAARLGYRGGGEEVADDIIGAVDTLGLMIGMHVPQAPGALMTRRERIAGRERIMSEQVPAVRQPAKPSEAPMVQPSPIPRPEVIPRPPGSVAAAEVPTVPARIEPAPGPALMVGEQRVVFPDENHSALFEYGEALTFGDELPAARADLVAQFGPAGAQTVDTVAKAYYDRVATKIESTAGEIQAGRVDEPGPATFRTSPGKIAQEHDDEVMRLETEAGRSAMAPRAITGFRTAKGSTYEVGAGGSTTRNKAARADAGHEGDSGLKTPSDRTIYVDPKDAPSLSGAGLKDVGGKGFRLILQDGKASLASWNPAAGRWGISPSSREIPYSEIPEVGKAPVEAWRKADDLPGMEAYRGQHAGNPIVELTREKLATRPKGYGDDNRLVSTSQADEARSLLNASVQRLASGVDPEMLVAGVKLALYHIEAGARSFAAASKALIDDLGEWARPYIRDWYDRASTSISEFIASEAGGGPARIPRSSRMKPPPHEPHANRAGNINLDRITAPDDVINLIRETADLNAGFPDARRGRMTFEDIRNLADAAGMDARLLAKRGVGVAFNAEEAVRLRDLLVTSATKVQELARTVVGASDEDLLKFQQALTRHAAIQEQVAGITAEAGRALASFNIKAAEVEKTKALSDVLERFGGRTSLEDKAREIIKLNDPDQISRTIRKMEKATTLDMITEAWINGLLSGPITHAANVVSNTITNVANTMEMSLAAGIGGARESAGLGTAERVYLGEAKERLFGIINGSQEALIAARQAFADDAAASLATGKLDVRRPGAIPSFDIDVAGRKMRVGGNIIRTPGRMLSAEDAFFQAIVKRQETSALAYRKAMQEGLEGERFAYRVAELTADPTPEMLEQIGKTQTYLTFTKPLGSHGRKAIALINDVPGLKFLVPFFRTPANILKHFAERNPLLAVFGKDIRANLSGRNGQVAQDTQLARLTLGAAVTISTLYWASSGYVTGSGPTDPRARNELYNTGWAPYSIKIGDSYYPYLRWLGPFGVLLGTAADGAEISDRLDAAESTEWGKLLFASATTNLLNQTWLQGPADLAQAINEPERYGAAYIQGFTSTLVPSILAQEARSEDPYLREARGMIDGLKARLPGFRQSLRPQLSLWGEPIERDIAVGPDRFSPFVRSPVTDDFISREMLRLGIWKAQPNKSIRGVQLDDEQYWRFRQIAGRLARQSLSSIVGRPGWDQMPAYAQANIINRLFDRSRESARAQMMISDDNLLSKIIQSGVSELVEEPSGAGMVPYPAMPAGVQ